MRIISIKRLRAFWESQKNKDSEQPLRAWIAEAKHAKWETPAQVKNHYRTASILSDNRVVFNIAGNKYRLITIIHYNRGIIYIRFIGPHSEYDRIDAEKT